MGQIGGSFAPPLSDQLIAQYRALIDNLDPRSQIKDAMQKCLKCCEEWWKLPDSSGAGKPHPVGVGTIVDLDKPIADALWEHIPWKEELEGYKAMFDTIDPVGQRDLRNAAHHLLWHAIELEMDREPLTSDKLQH